MSSTHLTVVLNRPPRTRITTLGPGLRVGVWFQGCDLGCPNCMSRDTWEQGAGLVFTPEELARTIIEAGPHDGLTVSGGEPFAQADGLAATLRLVRTHARADFDILCYSGHLYERLRERHGAVLGLLDALVDGPYRSGASQVTLLPWRGSANQRLFRFTPLGRTRYADADVPRPRPPLQLVDTGPDGPIEWVGIPGAGVLEQLPAKAQAVGVRLAGASWRS